MKFKSQGQMLSYVKEKEQKIIKEIDRRAEKEGVLDNNRLLDYKSLVTSILDAEAFMMKIDQLRKRNSQHHKKLISI